MGLRRSRGRVTPTSKNPNITHVLRPIRIYMLDAYKAGHTLLVSTQEHAMPARKRRIRHDQDTRNKIQAAQLINRLYKCAMGEVDMDSQQVTAAKTLLAKILPDLQSVEANITGTQHVVRSEPMSVEDWAKRYVTNGVSGAQITYNGHSHLEEEDVDGDMP